MLCSPGRPGLKVLLSQCFPPQRHAPPYGRGLHLSSLPSLPHCPSCYRFFPGLVNSLSSYWPLLRTHLVPDSNHGILKVKMFSDLIHRADLSSVRDGRILAVIFQKHMIHTAQYNTLGSKGNISLIRTPSRPISADQFLLWELALDLATQMDPILLCSSL